MTEAEWLTSDDPGQMLRFVAEQFGVNRSKAGRRKLRYLAAPAAASFGR